MILGRDKREESNSGEYNGGQEAQILQILIERERKRLVRTARSKNEQYDKLTKTMSKEERDDEPTADRNSNITIPRLGHKLQKIHDYLGLTNGELLVKINPDETDATNRSRISDYENEVREPSLVEVLNYARLVGIRIEILLESELNLPDEIANCPDNPRRKKRKAVIKGKKRRAAADKTSKKA